MALLRQMPHEARGGTRSTQPDLGVRHPPGPPRLRRRAPHGTSVVSHPPEPRTWSTVRVKADYLRAQFLGIKSRRGAKKAVIAVAASMLQAAFFMLSDRVDFRDLGSDHFERRDKTKVIGRLLRRVGDLRCQIEIKTVAA